MQRYILIRTVQAAITLWILSVIIFASVHLTGDPATYLIGPETTDETYAQLKKNLGLDKPLPVQYGKFMIDILHGDFGTSTFNGRSAREVLFERFPATLQLAGAAFILSIVVGIPLGILSAIKRDTIFDQAGKLFAVLGISAPPFWIAIMLIIVFGAWLGWQQLPLIILLSSILGAIIGISLVLGKFKNYSAQIPFGPYLAVAGWIALLCGESINSWYLGTIGF